MHWYPKDLFYVYFLSHWEAEVAAEQQRLNSQSRICRASGRHDPAAFSLWCPVVTHLWGSSLLRWVHQHHCLQDIALILESPLAYTGKNRKTAPLHDRWGIKTRWLEWAIQYHHEMLFMIIVIILTWDGRSLKVTTELSCGSKWHHQFRHSSLFQQLMVKDI